MPSRVDKLDSLFQKEISNIIMFELDTKKIGFCTVSDVKITSDLSLARVYVSFLGKNHNIQELRKQRGFVRRELAHRLSMRKIPEIEFVLDETLEKAQRIEEIIAKNEK